MKQVIVMGGMIILGVFIFQMILGPEEDSLKSLLARFWQIGLEARVRTP